MTAARVPRSREDDDMLATFGRRLRVLRLWSGLSEAEMAAVLGISARSLKGREAARQGSRGLTILVWRLVKMFGVSTDWLIGHEISDAYRDESRPLGRGGQPLERILS